MIKNVKNLNNSMKNLRKQFEERNIASALKDTQVEHASALAMAVHCVFFGRKRCHNRLDAAAIKCSVNSDEFYFFGFFVSQSHWGPKPTQLPFIWHARQEGRTWIPRNSSFRYISLYRSIHTKDESKRGTAFAFIFGVN